MSHQASSNLPVHPTEQASQELVERTPEPIQTFHLFPKFPQEIQDMIWQRVDRPRRFLRWYEDEKVRIQNPDYTYSYTFKCMIFGPRQNAIHPLLHTCSASRAAFMRLRPECQYNGCKPVTHTIISHRYGARDHNGVVWDRISNREVTWIDLYNTGFSVTIVPPLYYDESDRGTWGSFVKIVFDLISKTQDDRGMENWNLISPWRRKFKV